MYTCNQQKCFSIVYAAVALDIIETINKNIQSTSARGLLYLFSYII